MHPVEKSIEGIYEYATPSMHQVSRASITDYNISVEGEPIYDTPCDEKLDCGPIYAEPPTEIKKIYKTFEGKIICSKNVRYIFKCIYDINI